MLVPENESANLLLVGELGNTIGLATEMVRGSAASIAIGAANGAMLERWRKAPGELVMVDVAVNLPEVIARLRGERGGSRSLGATVEDLVGRTIAEVERALILQTLAHCRGNRTSAASMLGISVRTVRNKLHSFLDEGLQVSPMLMRS
ncbi:helix-turn-helix domain-containing protein [Sphingobium sp. H39-3-25]|jgi:DNA-binding NtrC family response regulator|uniref:helix-turn-helix domain-containing protein n=1 Tax=Sphingobium arseniciresistens TaxID=3030834 RepID=UPI0023B9FAA5|nr:helix-turn-helix domain-containing protein [Sphingobium arseniciresistens]